MLQRAAEVIDWVNCSITRAPPVCLCSLSAATKQMAAKRILSRVSEAYGRMLLLDGLFQADGHPGNILVMKGGKVGRVRGQMGSVVAS